MDSIKKVLFLILWAIFPGIESRDFGIPEIPSASYEFPQCEADLLKIADGLRKNELWAMKIFDASTKFSPGILAGRKLDFGNYDECLYDRWRKIKTQYCFASLRFNSSGTVRSNDLKWSYCMPESCPPKLLGDFLEKLLKDLNVNVTVDPNDCKSGYRKSLTPEDYIGISIWALFISLAVLSTVYDAICRMASATRNPVLSSFSVYSNGINLLSTKTTPDTMKPLFGLRFLSICWIILGHRYLFTMFSAVINMTDLMKEFSEVQSQIFMQGVLAVDTFFLLSGFLNCYNLLKTLEKTNRFPIGMYYMHRYLRLTPALAAIVLMYATWYVLIGDGPTWSQMTEPWKQLCVDNWWTTLLYINNYYNPTSQCAGQSWYLAVDMQLYWLSPLVIVPLRKSSTSGKIVLWLLLILSTLSVFVIANVYEFRAAFSIGLEGFEEYAKATKIIYVPTHTRATPYIIGLLLGHFIYNLRKSETTLVLSRKLVAAGWFVTTVICLSVLFGNYQFTRPIEDHPYNRWESSIYISLHRVGWGFGISWIIVSCLNKSGGAVNSILSWKAFIPLSRLTYCIFLTHMAVQQYQVASSRTSDYFQHFNQFHRFFGDLCFSIFLAAGLSLIFESPVLTLEKLITKRLISNNLKSEINDGYEEESPVAKANDCALPL